MSSTAQKLRQHDFPPPSVLLTFFSVKVRQKKNERMEEKERKEDRKKERNKKGRRKERKKKERKKNEINR